MSAASVSTRSRPASRERGARPRGGDPPRLPPDRAPRRPDLHELCILRTGLPRCRLHRLRATQAGGPRMTATVGRAPAAAAAEATRSKRSRILMKGNEAIAEAAIQAGCDAYFGYPITPQAELLEWMARRMPELGRVFVQAESGIAAVNMGLGAAATGARGLVSSSSPGFSLMAEAMGNTAGPAN